MATWTPFEETYGEAWAPRLAAFRAAFVCVVFSLQITVFDGPAVRGAGPSFPSSPSSPPARPPGPFALEGESQ